MSRSQRLFDLLQLLRCHKYPVPADHLAHELNVSTRTIYRDIATLQAQGAEIDGEAGVGYLLKPTFTLPPMMFSSDELEALRLGAEWVAKQANGEFSESARNAIAKISAVLPSDHQAKRSEDIIRVASIIGVADLGFELSEIKLAIKQQNKAQIQYTDAKAKVSSRVIWPMLIGVFENCYVLVAWCETRSAYRNFRLDRINELTILEEKYSKSRNSLLKEWQSMEGITDKVIRY
ncbi:helix-turn-helix transcriptional regulator [Vibrio splendidus]|uniref:helix-turn-helix transcriptional regulator n=1 Tax=Vibrio splendidus TaxID=29497 RepID=UPI00021C3287|nr:YafY family protein [Vibrio splendidus]EGU39712.1 transcriptional regulator [Vibrio splendidus ATCC 33789]